MDDGAGRENGPTNSRTAQGVVLLFHAAATSSLNAKHIVEWQWSVLLAQKKKKNRKQGHPARQSQHHAVSMHRAAAERGIDALTPAYLRWYQEIYGDSDLGLVTLELVRQVAAMYCEASGSTTVSEFSRDELVEIILGVLEAEEAEAEDNGIDLSRLLVSGWIDYLRFLGDSNLWSGEVEDLNALLETLEQVLEHGLDFDADLTDEAFEHLETEAVAIMDAMQLVAFGRQLLAWIGDGREVTSGGSLRPRDLPEAATCVGEAVSAPSASKQAPGDSLFEVAQEPEVASKTARRMSDVPLLERVFRALAAADIIEIGAGDVTAGAAAPIFADVHSPQAFPVLFRFVEAYLRQVLQMPRNLKPVSFEAWRLLVSWLIKGSDEEPQPVDARSAEEESAQGTGLATAQMRELVRLGLVQADTHYRVPIAVGAMIDEILELDDEDLEDEDFVEVSALPAADSAPAQPAAPPALPEAIEGVLQLKLGLKDAKPPIWRRVLVPADMTLDRLHQVIQASFEWDGYHLHQFEVGPARDTTYAPAHAPMENNGDEATVAIGQLLRKEKDRIDYIYDFGDNWELRIDLEKVLEADGGALPRCTGGRRMASAEDSGGTWGWENMVAAVNDPKHPEHEEYREWLGLEKHEQLDASVFDQEGINELLESLG